MVRHLGSISILIYSSLLLLSLPWQAIAAEKSQPFDIQVSKFDTLNGGTNSLTINDQRSGLIETSFQPTRGGSAPPALFRAWLEKYHPLFVPMEARLSANDVIEIKGEWDKADHPLTAMGIAHTTLNSHKLVDYDLSSVRVIVVNCAGRVPKPAVQKLRDFVAGGGALLTTDWALHNLLERSFPGYVRWNGGKSRAEVIDARIVSQDLDLSGVVSRSSWKLDDQSQTIAVLAPDKVNVLARSAQLAKQEPDKQGILAVTFRFGRGKVLHLIGHFDNHPFLPIKNALPDPAPIIGISLRQALAANFVISALQDRVDSKSPQYTK